MPLQPVTFDEALEPEQKPEPVSFTEAIATPLERPKLPWNATLHDFLMQQPYVADLGATGLVRSLLPGDMQPEDLATGGIKNPEQKDQSLFPSVEPNLVRSTGSFLGDTEPLNISPVQQPESAETTVPDVFDTAKRNRPQLANVVDSRYDFYAPLKTDDDRLIPVPQSAVDATKGTWAQLPMDMAFGQPWETTEKDPQQWWERTEFMYPFESMLGRTIGRKVSLAATEVQRELYNLAQGGAQFLNTEEGALATLASLTGPGSLGVGLYFTYDMLKATWDQMRETGNNWKELS